MNKQEFLAMSWKELKGIICNDGIIRTIDSIHSVTLTTIPSKHSFTNCLHKDFIPILHPLPDLTKPITHKGETFVPIEKLEIDSCYIGINSIGLQIYTDGCDFIYAQDVFENIHKHLLEWHFNLMDENEPFIDVNTLPENPYK